MLGVAALSPFSKAGCLAGVKARKELTRVKSRRFSVTFLTSRVLGWF